jgi:pyruvate formate lyase activating enzyme
MPKSRNSRVAEPGGLIFDIQKFSLHDGPGIRTTVFFKGCPLNCRWCHNLESQKGAAEAMLAPGVCTGCAACVAACPEEAIRIVDGRAQTDAAVCVCCGKCVVFCPQAGREICGREMTVTAVVAEVVQDRVFYERSGGGVTCSGGEAMAQIDFLCALLAACKAEGLHTCVDTSGCVPWESFERILETTDLFLYDLKVMDPAAHRRLTGVDNGLILENLRRLSETTGAIWIRFPVIPGINDGEDNIVATLDFLRTIRCRQVNLLPYHELGRSKADRLGRDYPLGEVRPPTEEAMAALRERFAAAGVKAVVGG